MMFERLKKNFINIPGKRIKRKLLVFESDDWGSIRTPNVNIRDLFLRKKLLSDTDPFAMYDTIESEDDVLNLLNILGRYRDKNGNHPIITTNFVVANPNYSKIRDSDFSEYHYEYFTETYKRYQGSSSTFDLICKGINSKCLYPQFHAREHMNFVLWMELLRKNNKDFIEAFNHDFFSINYPVATNRRENLMATYDYDSKEAFEQIKDSIEDGLRIFEEIFKKPSETTIAPCYVWDHEIEKVFYKNGVRFMQGSRFQQIPKPNSSQFRRRFHYSGQKSETGQTYFMRNGLFEPSLDHRIDWVDKCLESIGIAFKWNKPAIIGTHRLNYMGSLDKENRDTNLKKLENLIKQILEYWPEVEFVSTAELTKLYVQPEE
ncbi:MAG: hypothetical protein QNJ57_08735 [Flavobacteriaceae bacterium]|nr:hypothetical protein [Flavobacteriaceae bacterium]